MLNAQIKIDLKEIEEQERMQSEVQNSLILNQKWNSNMTDKAVKNSFSPPNQISDINN